MTIFEPRQSVEVNTPKGRARIWLVIDEGVEDFIKFVCIINSDQTFWTFLSKDVTATPNNTVEGFGKK